MKAFNLATNLSETQLQELGNIVTQREAKKGQVLYAKSDERKIFLLVSGKVKVMEADTTGAVLIKEFILPGDIFGDVMLNYHDEKLEQAEVMSDMAVYYAINQEDLIAMMRNNYMLTLNYIAKVSEKFKSLENRYLNMISKDVKSRLLYCLKEWARKEGKAMDGKVVVKNSLTHSDLANLISTSRQTVTVILNELKESGEINYNRKEIEFSPMLLAS